MNDLMKLIQSAGTQSPDAFLASLTGDFESTDTAPRKTSVGMREFIDYTIKQIAAEYDNSEYPDWRDREQFLARMRNRARRLFNQTYGRNEERDLEVRTYIRKVVASI